MIYPVHTLKLISIPTPAIKNSFRLPRTSTRNEEQQIATKKHQIVRAPLIMDWSYDDSIPTEFKISWR